MSNFFKKIYLVFLLVMASSLNTMAYGPLQILGYPTQDPELETLKSALFYFGEEKTNFFDEQFFIRDSFYKQGFVYSIAILKNHPDMHYKLWMQLKPAPLIAIIPGLGSHYSNTIAILLAKRLYDSGYSVMTISSTFNWDFMESAATVAPPGFTPVDSANTYYALYKIISHLKGKYKDRITNSMLVGYSLGGTHALFISNLDAKYKLINFSRIVAINPPVDLLYGLSELDSFFDIGNSWSRPERLNKIKRAMGIYSSLIKNTDENGKQIHLPFTTDEAKYIIGLIFHESLTNTLLTIQHYHGFGLSHEPFDWYSRTNLYKKADAFNYYAYIIKIFLPYYSKLLHTSFTLEQFNKDASLYAMEKNLRCNRRIRIIHNNNDFLLKDYDKQWLNRILGARIIFFGRGGHLGNMLVNDYLKYLLEAVNQNSPKWFNIKNLQQQERADISNIKTLRSI